MGYLLRIGSAELVDRTRRLFWLAFWPRGHFYLLTQPLTPFATPTAPAATFSAGQLIFSPVADVSVRHAIEEEI